MFLNSFICFSISYLATAVMALQMIGISNRYKIYDLNDLHRKTHIFCTPRLGGFAMLFGFLGPWVTLCYFFPTIKMYFFALIPIVLSGIKDDLLGGAGPLEKLTMQSLTAVLLLDSLTPQKFDWFVDPITCYLPNLVLVMLIVIVINAFNFIDGINGLSASVGLLFNATLAVIFYLSKSNSPAIIIAYSISGSISGFLTFNFLKGRIFMGDTGSMLLGFFSVINAYWFLSQENRLINNVSSKLTLILALLSIPLLDMFRVLFFRMLRRKNIFIGDLTHLHHRLRKIGLSDRRIVATVILMTTVNCLVALLAENKNIINDILILVACWFFQDTAVALWLRLTHSSKKV